jgi:hypothetical protein
MPCCSNASVPADISGFSVFIAHFIFDRLITPLARLQFSCLFCVYTHPGLIAPRNALIHQSSGSFTELTFWSPVLLWSWWVWHNLAQLQSPGSTSMKTFWLSLFLYYNG